MENLILVRINTPFPVNLGFNPRLSFSFVNLLMLADNASHSKRCFTFVELVMICERLYRRALEQPYVTLPLVSIYNNANERVSINSLEQDTRTKFAICYALIPPSMVVSNATSYSGLKIQQAFAPPRSSYCALPLLRSSFVCVCSRHTALLSSKEFVSRNHKPFYKQLLYTVSI